MDHSEPVSLRQAWIGSIAGWTFLLTASLLFGTVFLAPKILTYTKLQHDLADRHLRLLMIEDAVARAENIADSLRHDSEQAHTRNGNPRGESGSEEIPLPPELSLSTEVDLVDQLSPPPAPYPWYTRTLIELTLNRGLTSLMLLVAALLTVLSFLTSDGHPLREASGSIWELINRRYSRKPVQDEGVVPRPKFAQHESRRAALKRMPFSGPVRSTADESERE